MSPATPVMRTRAITTVVFDLYDTLLQRDDLRTYQRLFETLNVDKQEAKRIALTEHLPSLEHVARRLNPAAKIDLEPYKKDLDAELRSARAYDETFEVLRKLRELHIHVGVISNLATPYIKPFYALGLDKLVDTPVFSCTATFRKPNRAIYTYFLQLAFAYPSEALMTGDSKICDVAGPQDVGIRALHLDRKNTHSTGSIHCLTDILQYVK